MSENESQNEHSIRAIWQDDVAPVENYRIRPREVSDDRLEMGLLMRLGGPRGKFYVRAEVVFSINEDEDGHHVEIRRRGGDVVDEFTIDWTTADPDDATEATQALCETYINAASDWYSFAVGAEQAGRATGADASGICTTFTPATDDGDFGFVCPSCEHVNALEGDVIEFADVSSDCTECGYVALLDGDALAAFDAELHRIDAETCPEMQVVRRIHEALHGGVEPDTAVELSVETVEDKVGEQADMLVTSRGREDCWLISWGGADVEVTVAEGGKLWQIEVTKRGDTLVKTTHNDDEFPTAEEAGDQQ